VDCTRCQSGDRQCGRESLSVTDKEPLVLMVAKLTGHKGHTYLLRALPKVIQRFPNVRLALAGDGELKGQLVAEAASLRIAGHVKFLGRRTDIPDLFQAADLFVMPSYMEGLGTSLLDAIFARVPVVTTGAGGIADVIGLGHPTGPTTFTAEPRDSDSLARAIVAALELPQRCAKQVEHAYNYAMARFTHDHMVDGTLTVYRELLGEAARLRRAQSSRGQWRVA